MIRPLKFRLATTADLETCARMLHPGLRLSDRVKRNLVPIWEEVHRIGGHPFSVIVDPSRPHPDNIEGFGASVFIDASFAQKLWSTPRPYPSAIFYEEMLDGRSPVLSDGEVARANSGPGLDLVVLHFGLRNHDMRLEGTQRVLQCASGAFYTLHGGYRVRSLLNEVYGPGQKAYMEAGGFRIPADVANEIGSGDSPWDGNDELRPYLFGMRKEWLEPGAVNTLSFLFHPTAPVLNLSRSVQRVLARALLDETDSQIATGLGMSLDAVKQTWRRCFMQVEKVAPNLLWQDTSPGTDSTRGAEKRRHLISYVRSHPEELRPMA